jgi:hypothetical protein
MIVVCFPYMKCRRMFFDTDEFSLAMDHSIISNVPREHKRYVSVLVA